MADFSKMKWRIDLVPLNEQVMDKFDDLRVIYEEAVSLYLGKLNVPLSADVIMRMVVYAYHIKSPYAIETNIHIRRQRALIEAGIKFTDAKPSDDIVGVIMGINPFINYLALHFCKFENNMKWMTLCNKLDLLQDSILLMKEESGGTEKKSATDIFNVKLRNENLIDGIRGQIEQLSAQVFINDADLINYAYSARILEQRKRINTPERFAKRNG